LAAAGAAALLLTAANAYSVPQIIQQQGRLYDAQGEPVQGELTVVFKVYASQDAATPLWFEEHKLSFSGGFFSVALGSVSPFDGSVFDGSERFIGVTVEDDTEMSPRAVVTSVPYALLASDVDGDIHPTTVSIDGYGPVIDENGKWVGDPSSLKGPKGEPGAIGPQGPKGDTGPAGPQGVKGAKGDTGATGPQGVKGATGATGAKGAKGDTGATGTQGVKGATGATGAKGAKGDTGAMGPQGVKGATGATGAKGAKGDTGATGPQGVKGATGATGATGAQGPQGTVGPQGPPGPAGSPAPAGITYTRWGRSTCAGGAELVYSGYAGGKHWKHTGSGTNYLCLPKNPIWGSVYSDADDNGALVYGVEYEHTNYGLNNWYGGHNDYSAPCAVCYRSDKGTSFMQPARNVCPSGWNLEYGGYLMAQHFGHYASEYVCVDVAAEKINDATNHNGALWYPVEAECGSLECKAGGYVQNRELTCSVCSR